MKSLSTDKHTTEYISIIDEKTINEIDIIDTPRLEGLGPVEEVLFVGTGTSTGIPNVACLADPSSCLVCLDSMGRVRRSLPYQRSYGGPPSNCPSRNRRTNPSAIIRYRHSDGTLHSVLIDCGKTFYQNALRTILKGQVRKLDGVVLTHGHVDAILGLDDLRHWSGHWPEIQPHVDIYCDPDTFSIIKRTFPYLVDPAYITGGGEVGILRFHVFEPSSIFQVEELTFESLPVMHGNYADGRDYFANGFRIATSLIYLSDLSGIPPNIMERIKSSNSSPCSLLVVDCLFQKDSYKSHYCWPQTSQLIKELQPRVTVLVGMGHTVDYYEFQKQLLAEASDPNDGSIGKLLFREGATFVGFDGLLMRFAQ